MPQKSILPFLRESFEHWSSHRASRMGAALSYYTIFSIIPLLSLIVLVAGISLGHAYIQSELAREIGGLIGPESGAFIQSMLSTSVDKEKTSVIVSVISFIVLAIGTLGMLKELKTSMDDLWDVPQIDRANDTHWFKTFILTHLVSLSLIPVLVFLLIISLVFSSLLALAGPEAGLWIKLVTTAISVTITGLLFMFIYRYLPSRKLPWKEVFWGALVTALLFLAGKSLIGLYLAKFAGTSVFGTAGAFIVILLWIYYSVQIFFYGASMTYVWSRKHGHVRNHQ